MSAGRSSVAAAAAVVCLWGKRAIAGFLEFFALPGRFITCMVLGLMLLHGSATHAEPRPEPHESGPDLYAETRQALRASQWSQALSALQQLAHRMPQVTDDAEFHNLMGFTLRKTDTVNLLTAISHYHEALGIDPAHVQAREYLGEAYLLQGRVDLAREQLDYIERYCGGQICEAWRDLNEAIEAASPRPDTPVPSDRESVSTVTR